MQLRQRMTGQSHFRIDGRGIQEIGDAAIDIELACCGRCVAAQKKRFPGFEKRQPFPCQKFSRERLTGKDASEVDPRWVRRVRLRAVRSGLRWTRDSRDVETNVATNEADRGAMSFQAQHLGPAWPAIFRIAQAPVSQPVGLPFHVQYGILEDQSRNYRSTFPYALQREGK